MYINLHGRSCPALVPRAISLLMLFAWSVSTSIRATAILSAVSVVSLAQASIAATENDTPADTSEEDVITVTAPSESPLTSGMTPRMQRQPLPASDSADYLKYTPGFTLVRNGGTNGDPVFRGMFGSRLRMLVEGGEVLGACSSRMDPPSAYISPENFDIVSLTKGPQTVLWGPGASAGTLRFERVPPHFDHPGIMAHAAVLAGSNNRLDQNIDGALGNTLGYLHLMGNIAHADDYKDGAGRRLSSGWNKWNSDVAAGFRLTPDTLIELTAGKGDGNARYAARGMDGTRFARESIGLRFAQHALSQLWNSVEIRGWYHYTDHVMDNYARRNLQNLLYQGGSESPTSSWAPIRNHVDRLMLGGRGISIWQWQDVQLQGGVDLQVNRHRLQISSQWQEDAQFQDSGLFTEVSWHFRPTHALISGMRLEHTGVQCHGAQGSEWRREIYPSTFFRLEQQVETLPLMAYAGVGLTERFPDYWELITPKAGRGTGHDSFCRLKREKTMQLDFGAHLQLAPLDAWGSAYIGQVRDFILFRYGTLHPNTTRADNITALIHGGEAGIAYHFQDQWQLDSSLVWAFGENQATHQPLPQIPPFEGRLSLTCAVGEWSGTAMWRLVAAQHRIALNEGNVVGRDFLRSAGFGILSAHMAWKTAPNITISAGVDNLFNKRYSEHLNLAGNHSFGYASDAPLMEPGRTIWARASVTF
ncbi:TonB-dependent copper receptor [secondary endosymbiont of Ctenarytaina eucalypti]|uniref:TonB-dependent copper receptor n=1 Tax=secondary endosymbiont of Ctenarytaina eucalypti TaxID=1199245 RepID=J3YRY3_9ENTR|nr:TonB-dependent copper receptor [secondary endosymbiont of Ctenarytaina eucalypti]AFP84858.1 TonB-dependent copper receptor [secondary endosymbiont of Ctenarytaina eucalypti]